MVAQVNKLTAAIQALSMNGVAAPVEQEVTVRKTTYRRKYASGSAMAEAAKKGWVTRRQHHGVQSTWERIDPRDFAEQFIRKAGHEAPCKELFMEYKRAIGARFSNKLKATAAYNRFYIGLIGKVGSKRFTHRTEGTGANRVAFINVKSVAQLQDKPAAGVVQEHPIVEINKY